MNAEQAREVLADVAFTQHPTIEVRIGVDRLMPASQGLAGEEQPWLQLVDHALPKAFNSGRKWRLTQHMTVSEVVGTAFAAYKAWLEHEMMESFTYKGVQVFSPHVDIEARVRLASDPDNYEYRS
jgi:hypothetical protein